MKGDTSCSNFMVMDLLGKSLEELFSSNTKKLSLNLFLLPLGDVVPALNVISYVAVVVC